MFALGSIVASVVKIALAVVEAIVEFVKYVAEGLVVCVKNPVTFALIAAIAVAASATGWHFKGVRDKAAIVALKTELDNDRKLRKQQATEAAGKAHSADLARQAAERAAAAKSAPASLLDSPSASPPDCPAPTPAKQRVRPVRRASAPADSGGSWMQRLQALYKGY